MYYALKVATAKVRFMKCESQVCNLSPHLFPLYKCLNYLN